MPAKNYFNPEPVKKLQQALKQEENGENRERILIEFLLNEGKIPKEIAKFIGCSPNNICFWCVQGDPDNLESLKDDNMKGNPQKVTEKYIEILLETLDKALQELGYELVNSQLKDWLLI